MNRVKYDILGPIKPASTNVEQVPEPFVEKPFPITVTSETTNLADILSVLTSKGNADQNAKKKKIFNFSNVRKKIPIET